MSSSCSGGQNSRFPLISLTFVIAFLVFISIIATSASAAILCSVATYNNGNFNWTNSSAYNGSTVRFFADFQFTVGTIGAGQPTNVYFLVNSSNLSMTYYNSTLYSGGTINSTVFVYNYTDMQAANWNYWFDGWRYDCAPTSVGTKESSSPNYTLVIAGTGNNPPTFQWQATNFSNGSMYNPGTTIRFFANWNDDNGTTQVIMTFNGTNYTLALWNGTNTSGTWNYNLTGLINGTHYYNFSAYDGANASQSGTYSLSISQNVTQPPTNALTAYFGLNGSSTSNLTPVYRTWSNNGSAWNWSGENAATNLTNANTQWTVLKCDRNQSNCVLATMTDGGIVQAQAYTGGAWGAVQTIAPNIGATNAQARGFYVAFEYARAWGLVISANNTANPYFDIWYPNNNTWSGVQQFPTGACGGTPLWIEADSKPNSNEIMMAYLNSTGYCTYIWNGSVWGNSQGINNGGTVTNLTQKTFCTAYEQSSGRGVVFWEDCHAASLKSANWTGDTWQVDAHTLICATGNNYVWFSCASMPGSNRILWTSPIQASGGMQGAGLDQLSFEPYCSTLDYWTNWACRLTVRAAVSTILHFATATLAVREWNQGWGTETQFATTVEGDLTDRQLADVAYMGGSGWGQLVYAADTNFPNERRCIGAAGCSNGSTGWTAARATTATICGLAGTGSNQTDLIRLVSSSANNDTMLVYSTQSSTEPICSQYYNASSDSWGSVVTFEDTARVLPNARPFDVTFYNTSINAAPSFQWASTNFTNGTVYNLSQTVQFFANFTDDNGTASVVMTFNSTNYTMAVWNGTANTSITLNYNLTGLTAGTHYYNFTAYDGALATGSQTFSLFIARNNATNISFVSPMPSNGSTISNNYVYANVSSQDSDSPAGHSVYHDWNYSLLGWWSMDSYNNTVVYDNSSYGNPAYFYYAVNSSNITTGARGLGLKFAANNSFLRVNVSASMASMRSNMTAFSVFAWVNGQGSCYGANSSATLNGYCTIVALNDPLPRGWVLAMQSGSYRVDIYNGCSGKTFGVPTNNTWEYVGFTFDGSALRTYVNGNPKSYSLCPTAMNATGGGSYAYYPLTIGARNGGICPSGNCNYFNGSIDEVQFYNRSLTPAEVNASFNASAYPYFNNFTGLMNGSYYARAWSIDTEGNVNSTELRLIAVSHPLPNVTIVAPANNSNNAANYLFVNVSSQANSSQHSVFLDWNSTLLGWWSFDYFNTTDAYDNSTYARNATVTNAAANSVFTANGSRGYGYSSGGNSQRLNVTSFTSLNTNNGMTIMMWILPYGGWGANKRLMTLGMNSTDYIMVVSQNNPITQSLSFGYSGLYANMSSTGITIANGTWYHLAYSFNVSTGYTTLYINGVNRSGSVAGGLTQFGSSPTSLSIGNDQSGGSNFNGTMDEVMIFNRTLTNAEVNATWNAQSYQYSNNFTSLVQPATYTARAWAIDEEGSINTSGLYTFNTQGNTAPAFQWASTNFTNGSAYNLSQTVQFFANFTDDSGVTSVIMTFNSTNYTMAVWNGTANTSATFNYNLTGLTAGTHTYLFTASDGLLANSSQSFSLFIAQNNATNVSFVSPTTANGTSTANNWIYANVSSTDSDSPSGHSVFLDWNNSLMGWWSMDFTNASVVFDNSSNRNNATFVTTGGTFNNSNLSSGRYGLGVNFNNGSSQYLNVSSTSGLSLGNYSGGAFTIEAWFRHNMGLNTSIVKPNTAFGGIQKEAAGGSGARDYSIFWSSWSPGYWTLDFYNSSNYRFVCDSVFANVVPNTWYHVVGTYDGGALKVYVNGNLNKVCTPTGIAGQTVRGNTRKPLEIGEVQGDYWNGSIDEVRVYNRSLSAQEVNASYNATAYQLYNNFTSLSNADYYFQAWSIDDAGNVNKTEMRQVNVNNLPTNVSFVSPTLSNASNTLNNWIYVNVSSADADSSAHSVYVDWNQSLVGWWSMDFTNGSIGENQSVYDNSSYGNLAWFSPRSTNFGVHNLTEGIRGKGLKFDGTDDYLTVTPSNSLNLANNMTWIGWWKGNSGRLFSRFQDSNNKYMAIISVTAIQFYIMKDGVEYNATYSAGLFGTTTWYHFAFTFVNGSGINVYYTATNRSYSGAVNFSTLPSGANCLNLGSLCGSTGYFTGTMDEVKFYNRTLAGQEITADYNGSAQYYNNFTGLTSPATYNFQAWSIDREGRVNTTNNFTISTTSNAAPAFQWASTNFTNGTVYNLSQTIQFFANFTDDNGTASVIMTLNSTNYTMAVWNGTANTSATFNVNVTGLTAGTHTYFFTAYDGALATGSQTFSVFIAQNNASNVSFVSPTSPNGSSQALTNNSIYVNVSSSDSDSYSGHSTFLDWNSTLVGWWSMDFYNNTAVYDNSSFAKNGTFSNTLSGSTFNSSNSTIGQRGLGLTFGNGSYLSVSNLGNTGNNLTFMAWVNVVNPGNRNTVFGNNNGANAWQIEVGAGNGGAPGGRLTVIVTGIWIAETTNGNLVPSNVWTHIAYTRNGTGAGTHTLYVNGVPQTLRIDNATNFSETANNKEIGRRSATQQWFNGSIDEVMIFNRTLTNAEVNASFNASAYQYSRNFTALSAGDYYFKAWSIDDVGNVNSTSTRIITINSTVNAAPQFWWTANNFTNGSEYGAADIRLFSNWTDDVAVTQVTMTFNSVNYTMVLWNGTTANGAWNYNLTAPDAGTYYYNFTAVDGSLANTSQTFSLVIAQNTTWAMNHTLNLTASDLLGTYPASVRAQCSVSGTSGSIPQTRELRNGTQVQSVFGSIDYNETPSSAQWNFTCSQAGNTNYASKSSTWFFNVSKGTLNLTLQLNGTYGNKNYTLPEMVNASGWATNASFITPVVLLLENGTGIANGTQPTSANLTRAGATYNFSVYWQGNENYTTNIQTFYAFVHAKTNISFVSPTPANGSSQVSTNNSIYVNVSSSDSDSPTGHSVFLDWNNSLVLWLPFDFANSSVVFDNSTYATNMTFKGGFNQTNLTAAQRGLGLDFDGTANRLTTETTTAKANLNLANNMTFVFWVKASGAVNGRLMSRFQSTGNRWMMITGSGNNLYFYLQKDGSEHNMSNANVVFDGNTWNHIAIEFHNGTGHLSAVYTLYVNGNNRSMSNLNFGTLPSGTNNFTIGAFDETFSYFTGSLDEFQIYNRSLTPAEVNASYNASAYQYSNNFTSLGTGDYYFKAWAIDDVGNVNSTETRIVTISASANAAPAFQWQATNFTNGTVYNLSQTVRFFANFTDDNGTASVVMTFNSTNYTMAVWNGTANTSATFNVNVTGLTAGTHTYFFTAYDGALATGSQTFSLFIAQNNATNVSFVSPTSPNGSSQISTNNSIYVNVSSSDSDSPTGHSTFLDWNQSLVGWWSMDYYNSTVVYDNSTYANNATFTGTNFGTQNISFGMRGRDLTFGTNGGNLSGGSWFLSASNTASLQVVGNQTVLVWIYPTDFGTRRNIWGKAYGGEGAMTQEIDGSISYYWGTCGGSCTPYQQVTSPANSLNTWTHVALARNLSVNATQNGTVMWYKNGVLMKTNYASYNQSASSTAAVRIGAVYTNTYTGGIDEVMYFNRTLTTQEILAIYNATANQYFNNFTTLGAGDYYFKAWSIDDVGNVNSTSTRIVSIRAAPVFQWASANLTNGSTYNLSQTVQFFANFTDAIGVTSVIMTFNSTNYTMAVWNGTANTSITLNYNLTGLTAGTHTYLFTASNGLFATSSQTFSIFIAQNNATNVSFGSNTPADGVNLTVNYVFVNVSSSDSDSPSGHSVYLDWNNSLVGWWSMDSYNSTVVFDNSSKAQNASFSANAQAANITPGIRGKAIRFDGTNSSLNTSSYVMQYGGSPTGGATLCAWIYLDGTCVSTEGVFRRNSNIDIRLTSACLYNSRVYNSSGVNSVSWTFATSAFGKQNWLQVCTVQNFTGTNITATTYVNGVLNKSTVTELQDVNYIIGSGSSIPSYIGQDPDVANRVFNGSIDEVTLYNRTLTQAEILASYNASANQYSNNFTFTSMAQQGNYTYRAWAIDDVGNVNNTGVRHAELYSGCQDITSGTAVNLARNVSLIAGLGRNYCFSVNSGAQQSNLSCNNFNITDFTSGGSTGYIFNTTGTPLSPHTLNNCNFFNFSTQILASAWSALTATNVNLTNGQYGVYVNRTATSSTAQQLVFDAMLIQNTSVAGIALTGLANFTHFKNVNLTGSPGITGISINTTGAVWGNFSNVTVNLLGTGINITGDQNNYPSDVVFADTYFSGITSTQFRKNGGARINFIGGNLNYSNVTLLQGNFTQAYYTRVNVTYCSNNTAFSGATAYFYSTGGTPLDSATTDSTGLTGWRNISSYSDYSVIDPSLVNYTPHTFYANMSGMVNNSALVYLNQNTTSALCLNIMSYIDISLVNSTVNFTSVTVGSDYYSHNASGLFYRQFIVQNDGTSSVNITTTASKLFNASSFSMPTSRYRYNVTDYAAGSLAQNCSVQLVNNWYNFNQTGQSGVLSAMCMLGTPVSAHNQAQVAINVNVPSDEPAGSKTSTVIFTSTQG